MVSSEKLFLKNDSLHQGKTQEIFRGKKEELEEPEEETEVMLLGKGLILERECASPCRATRAL